MLSWVVVEISHRGRSAVCGIVAVEKREKRSKRHKKEEIITTPSTTRSMNCRLFKRGIQSYFSVRRPFLATAR